jgi:hypothetical protein
MLSMDHFSSGPRAVLGIDAAWTLSQPSGVALVAETPNAWRLVAADASYQRFHARGRAELRQKSARRARHLIRPLFSRPRQSSAAGRSTLSP